MATVDRRVDLYEDTEEERDTSTSVTMHKTASKDCAQTQLDEVVTISCPCLSTPVQWQMQQKVPIATGRWSKQKQQHVFRITNKQGSACGTNNKEANKGNVADTNAIDDDRIQGKMQEKTPCLRRQVGKPTANLVALHRASKVWRQCSWREWPLSTSNDERTSKGSLNDDTCGPIIAGGCIRSGSMAKEMKVFSATTGNDGATSR